MFQSLIGFKINWNNVDASGLVSGATDLFQSLIGFKINWNDEVFSHRFSMNLPVSIPNRV